MRISHLSLLLLASTLAHAQLGPANQAQDRLNEPWWAARHNAVLESVKTHPDTQLLLIGDSITNNYDKANPPDEDFQPTWTQFYAPRQALNLGFSGDTTAHVLWRLMHGEVAGLHPKVALVLIGTNNTGHGQTAEQTETGIDSVVNDLERRLPETHILLLGILPSAISPDKTERDQEVNRYLANGYGENPRVTYLDIGAIFYHNGVLDNAIFYDPRLPQHAKPLHPDSTGQHRMAEAIEPTLAKLMGDTPRMPLDSMTDINTAVIPVDRLEQDLYDWYARHQAELAMVRQRLQPQVVLIGDSITHFWSGSPHATIVNGPASWTRVFGDDMRAVNLGFGWDRTQNVLWRLRQGEFDGYQPDRIVLNIGTNNLSGTSNSRANTPEEIIEGMSAIIEELKIRSPKSHIILMAIFPRGKNPDNPFRARIQKTNELLAQKFASAKEVTLVDIGAKFLAADGTIPAALMPDATHPSDAGYQIWADALIQAGIKK